ncbi:hypothetical protein Tharo_0488 [Thauera aromatica K172]|uniref:Uncharacterized protein n=1 Tax=Thauera aromatica K172 TaxID=44139 RepID=A0A2R4BJD2_THAAR|nr:hypothetical protein Tharo_0488 [Thauera aromatica K172]
MGFLLCGRKAALSRPRCARVQPCRSRTTAKPPPSTTVAASATVTRPGPPPGARQAGAVSEAQNKAR